MTLSHSNSVQAVPARHIATFTHPTFPCRYLQCTIPVVAGQAHDWLNDPPHFLHEIISPLAISNQNKSPKKRNNGLCNHTQCEHYRRGNCHVLGREVSESSRENFPHVRISLARCDITPLLCDGVFVGEFIFSCLL